MIVVTGVLVAVAAAAAVIAWRLLAPHPGAHTAAAAGPVDREWVAAMRAAGPDGTPIKAAVVEQLRRQGRAARARWDTPSQPPAPPRRPRGAATAATAATAAAVVTPPRPPAADRRAVINAELAGIVRTAAARRAAAAAGAADLARIEAAASARRGTAAGAPRPWAGDTSWTIPAIAGQE
jgi:hypothetical protein